MVPALRNRAGPVVFPDHKVVTVHDLFVLASSEHVRNLVRAATDEPTQLARGEVDEASSNLHSRRINDPNHRPAIEVAGHPLHPHRQEASVLFADGGGRPGVDVQLAAGMIKERDPPLPPTQALRTRLEHGPQWFAPKDPSQDIRRSAVGDQGPFAGPRDHLRRLEL